MNVKDLYKLVQKLDDSVNDAIYSLPREDALEVLEDLISSLESLATAIKEDIEMADRED